MKRWGGGIQKSNGGFLNCQIANSDYYTLHLIMLPWLFGNDCLSAPVPGITMKPPRTTPQLHLHLPAERRSNSSQLNTKIAQKQAVAIEKRNSTQTERSEEEMTKDDVCHYIICHCHIYTVYWSSRTAAL